MVTKIEEKQKWKTLVCNKVAQNVVCLGLLHGYGEHERFLNLLCIMFGLDFIDMLFEVVVCIIKLIWLALA
jgi:hypothetical protein